MSGAGPSSGAIRIAGASMTSAPSARSRAARALDWARARVTAIVAPCSGRASSHARLRRSPATGPSRAIAGARIASAAAADAIVSSVALTTRWPGSVPRSITAAGSVAARPPSISRRAIDSS